jgi:hypothetical protein
MSFVLHDDMVVVDLELFEQVGVLKRKGEERGSVAGVPILGPAIILR